MQMRLEHFVATYNDAADRYNLARLEYAMKGGAALPPPAGRMAGDDVGERPRERPLAFTVEAIRDFFESAPEMATAAPSSNKPFDEMHSTARELVLKFLQVSLTLLGVHCNGIIDVA